MTKIEQKVKVAANSNIGEIYGKLNSVQKQTIKLFDFNKDGKLDAKEADLFNKTIFSDKGHTIECYSTWEDGTRHNATINKNAADIENQVAIATVLPDQGEVQTLLKKLVPATFSDVINKLKIN